MRRIASITALSSAACLAAVVVAPAASAGDSSSTADLTGRWKSAALKQDGAGYVMNLFPGDTANRYDAKLRFHYEDGKRGSLARAVVEAHGSTATLAFTGGSGETVTLPGWIGADGSLFFPTCYTVLPLITKAEAPAACLFQEVPFKR
jgi:hypothetical protein